jgi:hypothetical protein
MPVIEYYAIRQIATDYYFPRPQGRSGRGGSHVEPVPIGPDHPYNEIRLFPYKINAQRALTAWLKGTWDRYVSNGDYWDVEPEDDTTVHPVSWRRKEDYEVVPVTVNIPSKGTGKPIKQLHGAVFFGNGVLYGYRTAQDEDTSNLNIPVPEQAKAIKVSKIVRRLGTDLFESQNSIYEIVSWAGSQGSKTIPEEFQ